MKTEQDNFETNIKKISQEKIDHKEFIEKYLNPSKSKIMHPFNNKLSSFWR